MVVNLLAFYSDDLSLNPAEDKSFSVKMCWKRKNKQEEAAVGPFKNKIRNGSRSAARLKPEWQPRSIVQKCAPEVN